MYRGENESSISPCYDKLRIGWIYALNPEERNDFSRIRSYFITVSSNWIESWEDCEFSKNYRY